MQPRRLPCGFAAGFLLREFSQADSVYHEVAAARYKMQLLVDHLHRIRCGPGCGGG
jgi:hypothetical protein